MVDAIEVRPHSAPGPTPRVPGPAGDAGARSHQEFNAYISSFVANVSYLWAILVVTLPTQPNAVRLGIWRAFEALGCAALRDGAYLLPADHGDRFEPLAAELRQHGGTALNGLAEALALFRFKVGVLPLLAACAVVGLVFRLALAGA